MFLVYFEDMYTGVDFADSILCRSATSALSECKRRLKVESGWKIRKIPLKGVSPISTKKNGYEN